MEFLPSKNEDAIVIQSVGKMYKMYRRPADKMLDAFGVNRWLFRRANNYQKFWALRDLNLVVKRGERLGIIGRNGAGKSTLLKIIIGNVAPTEGKLEVHGKIQALMELGTGFHPDFTGRQNINASLAYQGLTPAQIRNRMDEIVDFAELGDFIEQPLKTYSAGMYARLAFSVATSIEPDILVIDEVLGAGDAYFASKCLERMRRLTEETGATVLFVSHDLGSIQQICTRVVWIERGQVVANGSPLDVTKAYYASILLQEEQRLRKRNERQLQSLVDQAPGQESAEGILGRLIVGDAQQPRLSHPVRRLVLRTKNDKDMVIEPGAPMDNVSTHPAYLMTDPLYMCWGEPKKFLENRVRCLENTGGRYGHAPFIFSLPADIEPGDELTLQIEHAAQSGEEVRVEIYDGQAYHLLGNLQPSPDDWLTQSWTLPVEINPSQEAPEPQESRPDENIVAPSLTQMADAAPSDVILQHEVADKYYSAYADFQRVAITDRSGHSTSIFQPNELVIMDVEVAIHQALPMCTFVVSMYALNGTVVAQLWWPIPNGLSVGQHTWRIVLSTSNLRQGEYIISCGLSREFLTTTNEAMVFYCLWDRALSLRVDEGHMGSMPLGIVRLQTDPPVGSNLWLTLSSESAERVIQRSREP